MAVFSQAMQFGQNTSDNLNPADSTIFVLKKTDETLRIIERASLLYTINIGHVLILNHDTNGKLGVNNGIDGQQITLHGTGRAGLLVLSKVVNPNNIFRERFRDTQFKGSPFTANWDTTNFRLAMHTSSNHSVPYATVAHFPEIFMNSETIISATVYATETKYNPNDSISYFLSADDGNTWQQFTKGVSSVFAVTGQVLRAKIIFMGNGGADTYIEDLRISYVV